MVNKSVDVAMRIGMNSWRYGLIAMRNDDFSHENFPREREKRKCAIDFGSDPS